MRLRFPFSRYRCAPVWLGAHRPLVRNIRFRAGFHRAGIFNRRQQTLLDRALCGCAASQTCLMLLQGRWMKRWFERELPACLRTKLDAEDLLQETYVAAWRGFARYRGPSIAEYRGWFKEIGRHCLAAALDAYRAAQCRDVSREVPLDVGAIARGEQRSLRGDPAMIAETREEAVWLLAGLSGRARQIVVWHVLDGRTFCDIARELGCCTRTVRREWLRARALLRHRHQGR